jgi:hypothetical protein
LGVGCQSVILSSTRHPVSSVDSQVISLFSLGCGTTLYMRQGSSTDPRSTSDDEFQDAVESPTFFPWDFADTQIVPFQTDLPAPPDNREADRQNFLQIVRPGRVIPRWQRVVQTLVQRLRHLRFLQRTFHHLGRALRNPTECPDSILTEDEWRVLHPRRGGRRDRYQ